LVLAAISAGIITAHVALPTIVTTIAYLAVAGTVLSAVSQINIPGDN